MAHEVRGGGLAIAGLLIGLAGCGNESPEIAYQRAELHLYRAEFQQARGDAERQLHRRNGEEWDWKFRNLLAETLLSMGKPADAAAQLQGHARSPELEARRCVNLALASHKLHRDAEANQLLDRVESLVSNPELLARAGTARGNWYVDQGNLKEAESAYLRIHDLYENQSPYRKIRYWINVGHLRLLQYRFQDAIANFENARAVSVEIGDRRAEQVALGNLGACYYWTGDYAKATGLFAQAESVAASISDRESQAKWLVVRGEISTVERNFRQAVELYQSAQKLISPADYEWRINLYNDLTESSLDLKDSAAASAYYREARDLCVRNKLNRLLPRTQLNGARLAQAKGEDESAIRMLTETVQADPAGIDQKDLWESHYRLASLYAAKAGRRADADRHYREALKIIGDTLPNVDDDTLKYTFLDSVISFYREYVSFLMAENQPDKALEVAASAHARVLRDKLGTGSIPGTKDLLTRLMHLVHGTNTVLLSYSLGDSRSFLWVVSSNQFASFELPSRAEIQSHLERYVNAISRHRNVLTTNKADGDWLFAHLVAVAQKFISADSNIIIDPDGPLHTLNFETLPVDSGAQAHYWIEDVTVSVTPSLTLLGSSESSAAPSLLLIGDPAFESEEFPRLADARTEMNYIQKYFTSTTIYSGANATPQAYLNSPLEKYSTIHITGHARADCEHPLNSAIVLAPEAGREKEHGNLLYAHDISSRRTAADLVTLSGCRTAGCKTYAGEGLTGLAWAFLSAGAHNVVAGLWNIADATTPKLMDDFYAERGRGKTTAAQAMRSAKRRLLSSGGMNAKPYYWAPFEVFTRDLRPANRPARGAAVLSMRKVQPR